jgi:ABC-type Fe3+-hydroxamate transport system substrate-binding protein
MKPLISICFMLLSCAPAFSADGSPAVFPSHLWGALDQATYDALRTSNQLAALDAVKEQKVVAGNANWSGFYWTARQTYMEFFGAAALRCYGRQAPAR